MKQGGAQFSIYDPCRGEGILPLFLWRGHLALVPFSRQDAGGKQGQDGLATGCQRDTRPGRPRHGLPTGRKAETAWRQSAIGIQQLRLAFVIIAFWLIAPAYCQSKDIVLLLEQTPVKGGEIKPAAGVHYFKPGTEIMLTAVPKPGYKFTHWLGEVSDATASSTVVYLNEPKVIIAVFEQAEQGISRDGEDLLLSGGGGGGGLFPTALDLSRPGGFGGGGGAKPQKPVYYVKGKKPTPQVPEPATGLLLMLGGLFALKRRSPKRIAG